MYELFEFRMIGSLSWKIGFLESKTTGLLQSCRVSINFHIKNRGGFRNKYIRHVMSQLISELQFWRLKQDVVISRRIPVSFHLTSGVRMSSFAKVLPTVPPPKNPHFQLPIIHVWNIQNLVSRINESNSVSYQTEPNEEITKIVSQYYLVITIINDMVTNDKHPFNHMINAFHVWSEPILKDLQNGNSTI